MLASQSQHRFILPAATMIDLAVATKLAGDEYLRLIEVVQQVARKLGEPDVVRWLAPNITACTERVARIEQILTAVVQENPTPRKEPS